MTPVLAMKIQSHYTLATWNTCILQVYLNRFKRTSISCTIENEVTKKSIFPPQLYTCNIEQNRRQCTLCKFQPYSQIYFLIRRQTFVCENKSLKMVSQSQNINSQNVSSQNINFPKCRIPKFKLILDNFMHEQHNTCTAVNNASHFVTEVQLSISNKVFTTFPSDILLFLLNLLLSLSSFPSIPTVQFYDCLQC